MTRVISEDGVRDGRSCVYTTQCLSVHETVSIAVYIFRLQSGYLLQFLLASLCTLSCSQPQRIGRGSLLVPRLLNSSNFDTYVSFNLFCHLSLSVEGLAQFHIRELVAVALGFICRRYIHT